MTLFSRVRYDNDFLALSARWPVSCDVLHFPGEERQTEHFAQDEGMASWWSRKTTMQHWDIAPHDHDFYELVLVCDGSATHVTNGGEQMISQGSLLVVPPHACHAFTGIHQLLKINVYYITEWLADDLKDLWQEPGLVPLFLGQALFRHSTHADPVHVKLTRDELDLCLREIGDILDQEAHPNPSLLLAKTAFLKMLARASAAYMRGRPRLLHESFRPEVWMALDEVENKISGSAKLSVDALARRCEITPEYLARLFKAATGESLMAYYQRRRIQNGTRMLLRPDITVTEVAHQLGYCDSSHFNRLFTRYHGVSPSVYREMLHTRPRAS